MIGFDRRQFLVQLVVLGVRQYRLVEHVIGIVMAFEFGAQPSRAPGSAFGRCGEQIGRRRHA